MNQWMWSVFKSINLNRSFKMVVFLCFDFQPSLETMSKTGGGHLWHRRQRWHGGGGGRGWNRSGRGRLSLGKCMKKSVMMIDSLSCGKIIPDFFWGMFFFVNGETWRYLIFGIIFSSRLGVSGFPSREPSNNLFLSSVGFTSSSSLCSPTEHCWDVPPWHASPNCKTMTLSTPLFSDQEDTTVEVRHEGVIFKVDGFLPRKMRNWFVWFCFQIRLQHIP